jgi:hypothetical protein
MAKTKRDKKLYGKMRDHGIRKRVARELSALPGHVSEGKQAPKALRDSVERLEALVAELKSHTGKGERQTAARKAARTRSRNAATRSSAARKAARTRAQGSSGSRSTGAATSRTSASGTKSRSGATAAKSRSGATASKTRRAATAAKSRSGASAPKSRARRSTTRRSSSS